MIAYIVWFPNLIYIYIILKQYFQVDNKKMDLTGTAKAFLEQYYGTMMSNKLNIANFYTNNSTMTYGGTTYSGLKEIKDKIESFAFQKIQFKVHSQDVQPGPIQGSFLVFVVGALQMDDSDTFNFTQVFNICPNGQGGFYVHNDVFTTMWLIGQTIYVL